MGAPSLETTGTTIERALGDAIERLTRAAPSAATKTLLIEARRLKAVIGSWGAIPPPAEARREMLARVMRVAADAGALTASIIPANGPVDAPSAFGTGPRATVPAVRRSRPPSRGCIDEDEIGWQPSATLPGVSSKLLHWDSSQGLFTALVKLEPGAELPARRHAALEELLVLAGSLSAGALALKVHAYCRSEIGDQQPALSSLTGCTLLLVGSERGEVLA